MEIGMITIDFIDEYLVQSDEQTRTEKPLLPARQDVEKRVKNGRGQTLWLALIRCQELLEESRNPWHVKHSHESEN
jgi:hypothetical protein